MGALWVKKLTYFVVQTDVQQFMWHTSQATLTQHVRQACGKVQALNGVMKTMTIIGEHTGNQFMRRGKDDARVSEQLFK